jgi:hypothetical protein
MVGCVIDGLRRSNQIHVGEATCEL